MHNRIENNGIYTETLPPENSADVDNADQPLVEQLKSATSQAVEQVSSMIQSAPGKTLLLGLAAGMAMGWMVKRS